MGITYNPFSLEGKTILVTGASSGIGRSTAIECSKAGAKVVLTARNEARLKETLSMLIGEDHSYIVADLANEEQMDRLVAEMPIIDGLVNNAGFNVMQLVPFIKDEDLIKVMRVNLEAPILLTHKVVKKKKIAKESSIVFTSSIAGKGVCSAGNSLYSASKGGLTAFMKNAALELASKKIRCNAVLPGMVETPLKEGKSNITEEQWEINRQLYPLKRFGNPEDVAYAIIYLLSDASAWMTGSELVIDGGRSLK
ncbi:MAG: SDR family oxidoreductase [Prevotella sp.]|nr:SDR family oxidoreductase [Prevotella sp.]